MVLPAGTTLPPLPYLLGLMVAVGAVGVALYREEVRLSTRAVLALSPWMVVGAGLYVLYQIEAVPAGLAPLFSSPSVYASTLVVAGLVWLGGRRVGDEYRVLAGLGSLLAVIAYGLALLVGAARGSLAPGWPVAGLVIAILLGAVTWYAFRWRWPGMADVLGSAGALGIFAHVLDGVSTAIGVDVLRFGEQTPLSRLILEAAGSLPTASVLGVGWLFVLVKVLLAVVVVWFLGDYIEEDPHAGSGLLLLVTAVGLGPGAHNLLLFTVLGPAGL